MKHKATTFQKFKFFLYNFTVCFGGLLLCHVIAAILYGIDSGKIIENIMNIPYIILLAIALVLSVFLTFIFKK